MGNQPGFMNTGRDLEDTWGSGHTEASNGKIALCRVYAVNAEERSCSIKTYGSDAAVANADFTDVQWLSAYSSPDGDEVSIIPRIGSHGVCCFIDGQPWIVGYFQPITYDAETEIPDPELEGTEAVASSAGMNKEKINSGDFIQRGRAGNRFVIRSGGEIELEATKVCRRTYFPTENKIYELCQNYEFRTDGGTIDWKHWAPDTDFTKCSQVWRTDVNQTNIIIDEKGTVELDDDTIWRYRMGALADFSPESGYRQRVLEILKTDGSRFYALRQPDPELDTNAYETYTTSDGTTYKGINDYSYFEQILPTGEAVVNINNNYQQVILPDGEMTLDIGIEEEKQESMPGEGGKSKFQLNIKPTGDVALNVADKNMVTIAASGEVKIDVGPGKSVVTIGVDGTVKVEATAKMEITAPLVDLKADQIKLGSGVSDVVPMGKMLLAAINKFIAIFNSHDHLVPQSPGGVQTSKPPAKGAKEVTADVLSATVKVQA